MNVVSELTTNNNDLTEKLENIEKHNSEVGEVQTKLDDCLKELLKF